MSIETTAAMDWPRPLPAPARVCPAPITWDGSAPQSVGEAVSGNVLMAGDMSASQDTGSGETLNCTGRLEVPENFAGQRLFLRFDSVGCFATLRLDGAVAATHTGSHTVWECPLPAGAAGKTLALSLELLDGAGTFSPYQKAGVLRGISLVARPAQAVAALAVHTGYTDGTGRLRLNYAVEGDGLSAAAALTASLQDAAGETLFTWALNLSESVAEIDCPGVQGWTAENPALYTLALALKGDGQTLDEVTRKIGFTGIEQRDPQLLWNGAPLKLRGVNYREPLPGEGHSLRADLELFKKSNVNFLRSLFYPFSEECLSLCDELGFYVEQCAPFQEVDQGIASTQNLPGLRQGYLGQFAEMLAHGLNHPCVAIWGLGHDSSWGANFRACYRLAKAQDPKRPVNFFLPMTVPEEEPELDIWSVANVDWRQPMDTRYDQMVIFHTPGAHNEIGYATGQAAQCGKPVLHCAYATPPCYNRSEAERDYGIHEFWGESMKRLWNKMQSTPACLGGAVMAAADEDGRAFPRLYAHHWGILNSAHAAKPEQYHLAMAYAPVAVTACEKQANGLLVTVENRFVHTPFGGVAFTCRAGDTETGIELNAAPGQSVQALLPSGTAALCYKGGGSEGVCPLPGAAAQAPLAAPTAKDGGAYHVLEENGCQVAQNALYRFAFSTETGLLAEAQANGKPLLVGGPFLQATRLTLPPWQGRLEALEITESGARACLLGSYGAVCRVRFTLRIATDGTLNTVCDILTLAKPMPHSVKAGVGLDPGGLNEYGIAWLAAPAAQSVDWTRDALYPVYPDGHIGRPAGSAKRADANDFTAMKHHVTGAAIHTGGGQIVLPQQGELSLRLEEAEDARFVLDDRDARLEYTGHWHLMDDYCGNFMGTETLSDEAGAGMELAFTGTGVTVYGPRDFLYGEGEASMDGGPPVAFCQYLDVVDRPGASRGYEKRYGLPLFSFDGLAEGEHTLRVAVKGSAPTGAQGAYVAIDRVVIHSASAQKPVRLIMNRDFNYARLVRGNYMRPRVAFAAGDSLAVTLRLCGGEE